MFKCAITCYSVGLLYLLLEFGLLHVVVLSVSSVQVAEFCGRRVADKWWAFIRYIFKLYENMPKQC